MKDHTGGFDAVNSEWQYAIRLQTGKIVTFNPQPDNLWLSRSNKVDTFRLKPQTVINLLNDALEQGLKVTAVNLSSGQALELQRKAKAPAKAKAPTATTHTAAQVVALN